MSRVVVREGCRADGPAVGVQLRHGVDAPLPVVAVERDTPLLVHRGEDLSIIPTVNVLGLDLAVPVHRAHGNNTPRPVVCRQLARTAGEAALRLPHESIVLEGQVYAGRFVAGVKKLTRPAVLIDGMVDGALYPGAQAAPVIGVFDGLARERGLLPDKEARRVVLIFRRREGIFFLYDGPVLVKENPVLCSVRECLAVAAPGPVVRNLRDITAEGLPLPYAALRVVGKGPRCPLAVRLRHEPSVCVECLFVPAFPGSYERLLPAVGRVLVAGLRLPAGPDFGEPPERVIGVFPYGPGAGLLLKKEAVPVVAEDPRRALTVNLPYRKAERVVLVGLAAPVGEDYL